MKYPVRMQEFEPVHSAHIVLLSTSDAFIFPLSFTTDHTPPSPLRFIIVIPDDKVIERCRCHREATANCNELATQINEVIGHFNEVKAHNDEVIWLVLMLKLILHTR